MKVFYRFFIFSLALLFLISCAKKEDVIKIGTAGPFTGDQARIGNDMKNGVELAVSEWNTKGGVLGKKIVLLAEDDRHDPKEAVSVANKLVSAGVVGVIGHLNSNCTKPASRIYNEKGIPMITPASTNPEITQQGFNSVFRTCGRDDQQGAGLAKFVIETLKKKKVAVLHDKTTYGQGLSEEFKKAAGDKVQVMIYEGVTQGDQDFKPVLTKVKSTNPDVIFFGGMHTEGGLIIKQAKELGIKAPVIGGDGLYGSTLLEVAGPAAEGSYMAFFTPTAETETGRNFVKNYTAKYGEIETYAPYAYDAANILLEAIAQAKTTDGKKLIEAIRAMKYEGAVGTIEYDAKGDIKKAGYTIYTVKDKKFITYSKSK
jgi:branched-chain amino acid transport system substrate-binding protein